MSISNLFAPNNYDLFAKSISLDPSAGGAFLTNNIDTINIGDALNIAAVRAGSLVVGNPTCLTTLINGKNLNLFSSNGNVVIDDSAAGAHVIFVGNSNAAQVTIGKPAGFVRVQAPLGLAGGTASLDYISGMPDILGTGGGCIPATPNFVKLEAYRINSNVLFRWSFIGTPVQSTVTGLLTIAQALPVEFRPSVNITAATVACVTATQNTAIPGTIAITTAGVVTFGIQSAIHTSSAPGWLAPGEFCSIYAGSVNYTFV